MRRTAFLYAALMWAIALLGVFLVATIARGQIIVPAEVEPYKLVPARLATPIPEGVIVKDGGWEVVGATKDHVADTHPEGDSLIFTGSPGDYVVKFDGVLIKPITVPGIPEPINSYVGRIKAEAKCRIKGIVNPPDPPDPPTPGGLKQLMFLYRLGDLDNLPEGQQSVLSSLALRSWISDQHHVFKGMVDFARVPAGSVPAKYSKWYAAWEKAGKPNQAIAFAPKDGGTIVVQPLPETPEAVRQLLGGQP